MGCSIVETPSGKLALRWRMVYPDGAIRRPSWTTRFRADDISEADRRALEAKAQIIGAEIRMGIFDPTQHFAIAPRFGVRAATRVAAERSSGGALSAAITDWIDRLERRRVPADRIRGYRSHVKLYITPQIGEISPDAITREVLEEFQLWLVSEAGAGDRRGVHEKTARNVILGTLKAFVRDREGDLEPFRRLKWVEQPPGREQDPFTREERDGLLRWFRDRRPFREYVSLLLRFEGITPSEVRGFYVGDFDRSHGCIDVRRSRGNRPHAQAAPTKTKARRRTVDLPSDVVDALTTIAGVRDPGAWLIELPEDTLRDNFAKAQISLGYRQRSLYQAKHTYATLALDAGENPSDVARHLGISLATLEKHYAAALQRGRLTRRRRLDHGLDQGGDVARKLGGK